jgi:glycosyltransferase involved in cell wall biosynthesis
VTSIYFTSVWQITPTAGSTIRSLNTIKILNELGCQVINGYFVPSEHAQAVEDICYSHPNFLSERATLKSLVDKDVLWISNSWDVEQLSLAVQVLTKTRRVNPTIRVIVDLSDVILNHLQNEQLETRQAVAELEGTLFQAADVVVLVSELEKQRACQLYQINPEKIRIISASNAKHEKAALRNFLDREPSMCMAGHMANIHNKSMIRHAVENIWPCIEQMDDDAELHIFGYGTEKLKFNTPNNLKTSSTRIKILGSVNDFSEMLSRYRVHLVPTISGSGIKTKVLESLSVGTPVVGNVKCIEGLDFGAEQGVYIANSSEEMAEISLKMISDEKFWTTASEAALASAKKYNDPLTMIHQVKTVLNIALCKQ